MRQLSSHTAVLPVMLNTAEVCDMLRCIKFRVAYAHCRQTAFPSASPRFWLEEESWMSVSTWGGSDLFAEETYPVTLLTSLLKQMMLRFGAHGACIALHDETIGRMSTGTYPLEKYKRAACRVRSFRG